MAIHRALKKTSSPRTSSAKRTKRVAAAVQSAKRTTRSPSSRKSTSPSSSSSSSPSPSPKRRRSTSSPSSERWRTTRDQRNVVVARSPAIASYSDAGVRCSYCRTALRADNRHGGLGLSNFRRHLVDQHPEGTFVEGPIGELEVLGMRHAHPFAGEKPCKLADADDHEREGLGTAALAAQDEADKKDAAETLLSFSEKLVLFTASEIPPRFRVASDEQR
ncbi:hypothetical protein K523DRAFT_364673 [Schizophyllum commune Tattone D]|nr:hypothetical protein K523DRAFT_364673 [Schizophyllum commune Tattone D]